MGLCPPALIFITVTLWLRRVWQTWDCEVKHDLYTPMSISKGEIMQISLLGLRQDSLEQKALLIRVPWLRIIFTLIHNDAHIYKQGKTCTDFYRTGHLCPGCNQYGSGMFSTCNCHSEGRYGNILLAFHMKLLHMHDSWLWTNDKGAARYFKPKKNPFICTNRDFSILVRRWGRLWHMLAHANLGGKCSLPFGWVSLW